MRSLTAALLAPTLLASTLLCAPARADSFTPAQRDEIVRILRDALVRDPTILRDAVLAMQKAEGTTEAASQAAAIAAHRRSLLADPADPVAGNTIGARTVVEFYDPRCGYCRQMLPVLANLLKADPSVRLVYKEIPVLGAGSVLDAQALVAAQAQGGYFALQTALMSDAEPPSKPRILALAAAAHLNPDRLLVDMDSAAVHDRLAANLALAQALGVTGTPTLVIGDTVSSGAMGLDELRAAISRS